MSAQGDVGVNTMIEDVYTSLVKRAYRDFELGDLDLLRVVMGPDVVWHEPGRSTLAGDYKGPEEVLGFLGQLKARSNGTFKVEILEMLSQPERVVVFQRETATRNGKSLDVIAVVDYEIHHQQITEVTVYQADAYQFDEFWERRLGATVLRGFPRRGQRAPTVLTDGT